MNIMQSTNQQKKENQEFLITNELTSVELNNAKLALRSLKESLGHQRAFGSFKSYPPGSSHERDLAGKINESALQPQQQQQQQQQFMAIKADLTRIKIKAQQKLDQSSAPRHKATIFENSQGQATNQSNTIERAQPPHIPKPGHHVKRSIRHKHPSRQFVPLTNKYKDGNDRGNQVSIVKENERKQYHDGSESAAYHAENPSHIRQNFVFPSIDMDNPDQPSILPGALLEDFDPRNIPHKPSARKNFNAANTSSRDERGKSVLLSTESRRGSVWDRVSVSLSRRIDQSTAQLTAAYECLFAADLGLSLPLRRSDWAVQHISNRGDKVLLPLRSILFASLGICHSFCASVETITAGSRAKRIVLSESRCVNEKSTPR